MPYPFDNCLVEDTMIGARILKLDSDLLWSELFNESTSEIRKVECRELMNSINLKLNKLRKKYPIPPRDFDIYTNPAEIAVKRFESKNPRPIKTSDCKHGTTQVRLRKYRGGSEHVVVQCLECGSAINNLKKANHPDFELLPLFDDALSKRASESLSDWESRKYKVYHDVMFKGMTIFDREAVCREYDAKHPEPFTSSNCLHSETRLTRRSYSSGSSALVKQCVVCGKHVRSVPKDSADNSFEIAPFNESLEEELYQEYDKWHKSRSAIIKDAHKKHREQNSQRVRSGEATVNTTFNTYYSTQEWERTRLRILDRDSNICQACKGKAECAHHLMYERLGKENDLDLISLCHRCHTEVHDRQDRLPGILKLSPKEIASLWETPADDLSHYFRYDFII